MRFDVATILAATAADAFRLETDGSVVSGGLSPRDLATEFTAAGTHSRTISERGLFIALAGGRSDGHHFVGDAFDRGARGAIVTRVPENLAPGPERRYVFVVRDPLRSLQQLATYWRCRHDAEVIGITGSIGKSTTKEIVASVLASRWPVLKNVGNWNTEIGLPLTLLQLSSRHQAAVLEMGMYGPGEIAALAAIARPRIGAVTMIAPVHLERLGTIERIARAKSELVAALPPDGLAVLNGDDPWTRAMAHTSGIAHTVLVGCAPDCDYRAQDIQTHGLEGLSFTVRGESEETPFRATVPGAHLVRAFLIAIAIGRELGMSWSQLQEAIAAASVEGRQRIHRLRRDLHVIDDTYNAAPESVAAALDLLCSGPGSKIAVLGDMLELGPGEEQAHRKVGEWAAAAADWLIVRGPRAAWIATAARDAGMMPSRIIHAASNADAAAAVRHLFSRAPVAAGSSDAPTMPSAPEAPEQPVWTVLVKGSRGMGMEEIVKLLQGEA